MIFNNSLIINTYKWFEYGIIKKVNWNTKKSYYRFIVLNLYNIINIPYILTYQFNKMDLLQSLPKLWTNQKILFTYNGIHKWILDNVQCTLYINHCMAVYTQKNYLNFKVSSLMSCFNWVTLRCTKNDIRRT